MRFSSFLKEQLTDTIDNYKKYFRQTLGVAITFTIICFVIAALLFKFSNFDKEATTRQVSLLSYFFYRYSKFETYSLVDLTKTVFIFGVSLFSIGMIRLSKNDTERRELSFTHLFRVISGRDIILLLAALLLTSLLDFTLVKLGNFLIFSFERVEPGVYISNTIFHLRIYLPLILFALVLRYLTKEQTIKLTLKRILFLYISLWLCNEIAYEFFNWLRVHVFALILLPFHSSENSYLIESFLGIPLIALFFLGYYSALTTSLTITEKTQ
jgi:hypothetical protein